MYPAGAGIAKVSTKDFSQEIIPLVNKVNKCDITLLLNRKIEINDNYWWVIPRKLIYEKNYCFRSCLVVK